MQKECLCRKCGARNDAWLPYCPACGADGALVPIDYAARNGESLRHPRARLRPIGLGARQPVQRLSTGIAEVDAAFGGGIALRQSVVLAGEPGIGKSTLLSHICVSMDASRMSYIASEESEDDVADRFFRLTSRERAAQVRVLSTLDEEIGVR